MSHIEPYQYILIPLITLIISQMIKFFYFISLDRHYLKKSIWILTWASGIPSTHIAILSSLAMTIGLYEGFTSPLFASITLVTGVLMYDLMLEKRSYSTIERYIIKGRYKELFNLIKEGNFGKVIGHTALEIMIGILIGISIAVSAYYI